MKLKIAILLTLLLISAIAWDPWSPTRRRNRRSGAYPTRRVNQAPVNYQRGYQDGLRAGAARSLYDPFEIVDDFDPFTPSFEVDYDFPVGEDSHLKFHEETYVKDIDENGKERITKSTRDYDSDRDKKFRRSVGKSLFQFP